VCWINYKALEPGTAAFVDGEGGEVGCAAHATLCTDEDCDLGHPLYAYATRGVAIIGQNDRGLPARWTRRPS